MLSLPMFVAALATSAAVENDTSAELEPVVIIATRSARPISEVAALVDLIDADDLAAGQVTGFENLARYHVGIEAESGSTRFGANGLTIRGIGGNRVAMEFDGAPISDQFSIGSYSNAGRALVDTELLSRIEVLRGPASSLYGSDAIGGVVGFFTWRPEDLAGRDAVGYRMRMGRDAASNSSYGSLISGWQSARLGVVGGIVVRTGGAPDISAPSDVRDPIDTATTSALLKLEYDLTASHRIGLAAGSYESERRSTLNSPLGFARFRTTSALTGDDRQSRHYVQARWDAAEPLPGIDDVTLLVSHQSARTKQQTFEERASRDQRFRRDFFYDQTTTSARLSADRLIATDATVHRLSVGFEAVNTNTEERRDARLSALDGSSPTNVILGEVYPLRDFPNSTTRTTALWLQDEVSIGTLTLIPSLRYDRYRLRPQRDALYLQGDQGVDIVSVNESQVTSRLGAVWQVGGDWSLFGQYASGFRAPPFEDANVGLDIPFFNIRAIPNPDLRSERSHSVELGVRQVGSVHSFELAGFVNRYTDFIETRVPVGVDPLNGATLFQSRNIERASIEGAELRYRYNPQGVFESFALRAQMLTIRGEDTATGAALATVSPDEALVGVSWQSPAGAHELELVGRAARGVQPFSGDPEQFSAPGYGVVDLLGRWRPRQNVQLRMALLNLTDRAHWTSQSVQSINVDDPMLPLLSAPGRSAAINIEITF